jgi:hypothetical protein
MKPSMRHVHAIQCKATYEKHRKKVSYKWNKCVDKRIKSNIYLCISIGTRANVVLTLTHIWVKVRHRRFPTRLDAKCILIL